MARRLARLAQIPIETLAGVGPARAKALAALEVTSVLDLLMTYPRRYIDRSRQASIAELLPGEEAMVMVEVTAISQRRTRGGRALVEATASDGRNSIRVTFFNQPWRAKQLKVGTETILFGRLEHFRGRAQMTNPVVDLVGDRTGRIIPVYPQSERSGLMTWEIARLVEEALDRAGEFAEPIAPAVIVKHGLVDRTQAFRGIHLPESMPQAQAARARLVFDELVRLQVALVERKARIARQSRGLAHTTKPGRLLTQFLSSLSFPLTSAQERVISEIQTDMAQHQPMHRLLQGDVGAGKTLVAVAMLLTSVENGFQGALMAPTSVLAEQHAAGLVELLDGLSVEAPGSLFSHKPLAVELLTNQTVGAKRKELLADLAQGRVNILVGTHALIQEGVSFKQLGAVVIDEQHRFGVEQRAVLRTANADGSIPDVLVMTATPIPRTAAMTVYGDLDVSILDELPPGRTPITTRWVWSADVNENTNIRGSSPATERPGLLLEPEARPKAATASLDEMWAALKAELDAGRSAYVVCPLVEESEHSEAAAATKTFEALQAGELAAYRLGLIHGRLSAAEKAQVMDEFRHGELDVLVATTVIEVGVDVPNATVMVILDADRFGIAQLHQLRGRVGRGSNQSWCYLVSGATNPDSQKRLEALVKSTDGFDLAEIDLELRGEGTLMDSRQKGRNDLRLASLRRDRRWVGVARQVAEEILEADETLRAHPMLVEEIRLLLGGDETSEFLLKS